MNAPVIALCTTLALLLELNITIILIYLVYFLLFISFLVFWLFYIRMNVVCEPSNYYVTQPNIAITEEYRTGSVNFW